MIQYPQFMGYNMTEPSEIAHHRGVSMYEEQSAFGRRALGMSTFDFRSSVDGQGGFNNLNLFTGAESTSRLAVSQLKLDSNPAVSMLDPESSAAIGQDAGLIMSLRENGFDFFIEYKDLQVD